MDVPWTIVGHSDRKVFGEGQDDVVKKVREALSNNIKVIYFIGETSLDRGMGREHDMHGLKEQLRNLMGLHTLSTILDHMVRKEHEAVWAWLCNA